MIGKHAAMLEEAGHALRVLDEMVYDFKMKYNLVTLPPLLESRIRSMTYDMKNRIG